MAPAAKPVVAQEPVKIAPEPAANPATASTAIPVKVVPRRWEQLEMFAVSRTETRMTFDDDDEDCPY
jgi:hypothetical protein